MKAETKVVVNEAGEWVLQGELSVAERMTEVERRMQQLLAKLAVQK